jgi:cyclophilin family peptidyl-prolyl cis-trans isomerase
VRGAVGMARRESADSGNSEFYIDLKDNVKHLGTIATTTSGWIKPSCILIYLILHVGPGGGTPDGYTVFGEVVSGMQVADLIAVLPTEKQNGLKMLVENVPISISLKN